MPTEVVVPAMQDPYSSHPPSSAPRKRQRLALIVEHHIWLRLTLTSLFEEIGFAVTTASNGYAGLRRAIDLRPNVVVLGNALPELSSAQVADELRNLRDPSGMQVILTSSLLGADERNRREKSLRARSARPWSELQACRAASHQAVGHRSTAGSRTVWVRGSGDVGDAASNMPQQVVDRALI
jgi:CheY-like chemotaxis protein